MWRPEGGIISTLIEACQLRCWAQKAGLFAGGDATGVLRLQMIRTAVHAGHSFAFSGGSLSHRQESHLLDLCSFSRIVYLGCFINTWIHCVIFILVSCP